MISRCTQLALFLVISTRSSAFRQAPTSRVIAAASISAANFVHLNSPLRTSSSSVMCRIADDSVGSDAAGRRLFYSKKDFGELGLSAKMMDVLKSMSIVQPSKIQAISFYGISSGKPCIIADQTGSGKTLAYLIPTIERMLQRKSEGRNPSILILTPTTELALQVAKNVRAFASALKFRTACLTAVSDMDSERKKLRIGADVVVATPGRLLPLLEKKELDLSGLDAIVLDEADVLMLDESFPLKPIGASCSLSTQFLFATATLPANVVEQIEAEFPDVLKLTGPGLHRVAPNIVEELVDCSGHRQQERSRAQVMKNKQSALRDAIDGATAERTLIFCNTIEQCRRVENILQREDRQGRFRSLYSYHGAIETKTREENLKKFSIPLLKKPAIMICTDRASRGMDFNKAHVDHVILFDFPQEPSEYLRRVGRTGRAGRAGRATVLAYGRQVDVARTVMQASIDGKKIEPGGS